MLQTLTCSACHKPWNRESSRGRKPKFCPTCSVARQTVAEPAKDDTNVEILICEHGGHEWRRTKSRGRKPPFCPQHRIVALPDAEVVERPKGLPSVTIRPDAVQRILDGSQSELRRKLCYTVKELENPAAWREHGDWTLLIDTHKRLAEQAERAQQRVTYVLTEDLAYEIA